MIRLNRVFSFPSSVQDHLSTRLILFMEAFLCYAWKCVRRERRRESQPLLPEGLINRQPPRFHFPYPAGSTRRKPAVLSFSAFDRETVVQPFYCSYPIHP